MTDSRPTEDRNAKEQEEWYKRTPVQVVGVLIGIALFGLVLGLILNWYIAPTKPTHRKDVAQALGLITAGAAGAFGIYFTWRTQRLARQSQEQNQQSTREQLDNAQEELRLTRQGQMTERFTQAIEQLGSDKLEIRLGGIYSLERTAQEEKNYHWPVMEVLTSYVRRHAAREPDKESRENAAPPKPDIQAILDVIGRRSEYHRIDKEVEYGTIDLNNTDLEGADLQEAFLQGANLRGAILQAANVPQALLFKAFLQGADLQEAILLGADLQGTDLQGASGITVDQIEWTIGSNETNPPEGFNRPELWSKSWEEQFRIIMEHRIREG